MAISDFYERSKTTVKQTKLTVNTHPDEVFDWHTVLDVKVNELKDKLCAKDCEEYRSVCVKIFTLLDTERPYLNPDFQMNDLSRAIDIPKHQIQFVLNNFLQIKFTDLKNEYRVRTALKLMRENANLSLDGIGVKSGFASNSNFYSSFKTIMNQTPSQWLKQNRF